MEIMVSLNLKNFKTALIYNIAAKLIKTLFTRTDSIIWCLKITLVD
jgi:hypothetical protein